MPAGTYKPVLVRCDSIPCRGSPCHTVIDTLPSCKFATCSWLLSCYSLHSVTSVRMSVPFLFTLFVSFFLVPFSLLMFCHEPMTPVSVCSFGIRHNYVDQAVQHSPVHSLYIKMQMVWDDSTLPNEWIRIFVFAELLRRQVCENSLPEPRM